MPRKLRVVTLVDRLAPAGGGETFAIESTKRLNPARFDRTLCVSRWDPRGASRPSTANVLEDVRRAGIRYVGLKRRSRAELWAWWPLLSLLRRERVDILHTHMFGSNVWGAVLGTLARTPVVVAHEQTWSFEGRPLRRLLDRELIARRADAFIAVSREDRRRMIEIEGIHPEKVVLLPNATPAAPAAGGRDVRTELGIPPEAPVIGAVCILRPQKALDVVVRAAAILAPRFPGMRVLIVGDGPERERIEALVTELGLEDIVVFLGMRTDVPDVVRAMDIGVLSSDFEGTPLAIMEYMDGGRPVVATRVGGIPDLIDHGVHGLLVAPQDPPALAASVAELLLDRTRATEMGRRGRERRRREFDLDATVRRLEELYEKLYDAGTGSDPGRVSEGSAEKP
jgi:glycosyltransferase involved in cell wall biosynthesis